MRRILVTGSTAWKNEAKMTAQIIPFWFSPSAVLVSGHAEGADLMAEMIWARWLEMEPEKAIRLGRIEIHPADWSGPCRSTCRDGHRRWKNGRTYCPAAGNYRNAEMIALGATVCLAFACWCERKKCAVRIQHYTHGTQDCVSKARRAGIPVTWTGND